MPSIQFGNTTIPFSLSRKDLKRVAITVQENGAVSVTAPHEAPDDKVFEIVKRRADWILEKQELVHQRVIPGSEKEWVSGEGITYLGRTYRLKVQGGAVALKAGVLHAPKQNTKEHITAWFKERALKKYEERLKHWAPRLPVSQTGLLLGDQKGRWGSCDKHGVIRINWRAIIAPLRIVDYILVHELAHLKHPDHSQQFWKLVKSVMADYEDRKEWLRIHGATLKL